MKGIIINKMYNSNMNVLLNEMLFWNAELIEILIFKIVIPKRQQQHCQTVLEGQWRASYISVGGGFAIL